jgi:hypothetical protein
MENKVVVVLDEQDLVALQQVILDDDEKAALAFLKDRLCPKIPAKGSAACDSSRLNPYLWKKK